MEKKKLVKKEEKNKIIITNDIKRIVKLIAYLGSFFSSLLIILTFVFGIITSLSVINSTTDSLLSNNYVITFISKINNCSIYDTRVSIMNSDSKLLYALFDIILPVIALIFALLLIILVLNSLIKFVEENNTNNDIFTKNNISILEKIINIISIVLFITYILFNSPSIIFLLFIYFLLYMVFILFKMNVKEMENN